MENQESKRDYLLVSSIIFAGVLIAGSLIYSNGLKTVKQTENNSQDTSGSALAALEVDDDVILGNPDAKVTLIEFSDYQCPFCGKFFTEVEPLLREEYIQTGKVRMIYKDFAFLGPESLAAAEAAECAKDQSKYWDYHDALFEMEISDGKENSGNLSVTALKLFASNVGLNQEQFDSCLDSKKYKSEVEKDYKDGQAIGVRATPTLFINGQKIEGALPYDVFKEVIEVALKAN